MNKFNKSILMAFVALATFGGVKAQSKIPQYVTFQAVARDDNNKPIVKQPIQVKLIITQGSSTGTPVYGAIYEDSTNLNGEFSRILGSYTPSSLTGINDKFENIPWEKGDMWVNIEYKSAIVGSFKKMGSFQFLAQPYAFSSKYAEKLNVTATQGQVLTFDGTNWVAKDANTTAQKLTVAGTTGQVLTYDGTNWVAKDAPKPADATWAGLKDKPTLAPVATSGKYTDLTDKPTGTAGQVLTYDGTNWVAKDANTTAQKLTVAGTTGQVLTYDGTNWVAKDAPKPADATWAGLKDKPTLAPVATSGKYDDLTNKPADATWAGLKDKPTIPTKTSELSNDAGFGVFMPGMIMPWAGDATTVPNGWMLCDGTLLNKNDYKELFDVIQTFYGNTNGNAGYFNLPDFRGMFLRGANNGAKFPDGSLRDPDAEKRRISYTGSNNGDKVGSLQWDAFQGHKHDMYNATSNETGADAGGLLGTSATASGFTFSSSGKWQWTNISVQNPRDDGTNGTPRISNETRPQNIYVNYIIKVK